MKTGIIVLLIHLAISTEAQTPGKDSLYLMGKTSNYTSTNMTTGASRGSTNVAYYYKLGSHSSFVKVKGTNYKNIVDVFPASSKKYRQCVSSAKQATLLGGVSIALVGTFIAGAIIGVKNMDKAPVKAYTWLGVGAVSLAGIYILPRKARKKANESMHYFEESAMIYNTYVKK